MLSKKAIEDFKALYKKHFGKDISTEEALKRGENLLTLYKAVYKPIPQIDDKQNKTKDIT